MKKEQQDINNTRKRLGQNFAKIKSKIIFLDQKINGPNDQFLNIHYTANKIG